MEIINKLPKLIKRQKILAAYFYLIGRNTEKATLYYKHLFLLSKEFNLRDAYDFLPYKFGPYSFTLQNDLRVLEERGVLKNLDLLKDYLSQLDQEDIDKLVSFFEKYRKILLNVDDVVRLTYKEYPYFAINSEIVSKFPDIKKNAFLIKEKINAQQELTLFTLGYESRSIEDFFNLLIQNNINSLVDVRCNRFSMKFGFSDGKLSFFCKSLGIDYVPFSELGIESDKRQNLHLQEDYDKLFLEYRRQLPSKKIHLNKLRKLLLQKKRIALMCFELEPHMCHRTPLAEELLSGKNIPFISL